jgi:hypothetical protein
VVAGERLFFPCKAARRDDFRERHSDPVGTRQDILRGFIAYLMKMTELQADLAKEFFKPIETVVAGARGGNE